jgi:hypothetical protein
MGEAKIEDPLIRNIHKREKINEGVIGLSSCKELAEKIVNNRVPVIIRNGSNC